MSVVSHGKWNFDYQPNNKLIYNIQADIFDDYHFKKYDSYNEDDKLQDFRKASLIHKLVRTNVQKILKNGVKYSDIVNEAYTTFNKLVKPTPNTICDFAFPIGISVNEIIAHDSAFPNDNRTLNKNDIVKIDIGIHQNGSIIDCAWTQFIDPDEYFFNYYTPLLDATKDATYSAIALAGVDVHLIDISTSIHEIIESYELEDGTPIKAVKNLGGHDILSYQVHGDKLILSIPDENIQSNMKMNNNEIYAIETYASTGYGNFSMKSLQESNHLLLNDQHKNKINKILKNPVTNWVYKKNNCLPFTQYQLFNSNISNYEKWIRKGIEDNFIIALPPLTDKIGSYTSQLEHTICIHETGVEILSLGKDY